MNQKEKTVKVRVRPHVLFRVSRAFCIFIAGPREARNPNLDSDRRIPYYACAPCLHRKLKFCSATKNDQNAKNVSIITVCHMGSKLLSHGSKYVFCWRCLSELWGQHADVVEASYEIFERNWVCCRLFFKVIYNIYILLDVLLCSIAEYFYELCRILASP